MDKLKQTVNDTIKEYRMLEPGSRVIAALSGGADSVCLLAVLLELKKEWNLDIRAVHVHHGLRGAEADRDAEFAKNLCERYSVPIHIIRADVRKIAEEKGLSEEEAGRMVRYESFEREAESWEAGNGVRIAVAHHAGDQAETILHNLFRGSGLAGLKGIPYVRGRIIRPLLDVEKDEILKWLKERGLDFVQDSTNASGDYTRNRIRRELLPEIESKVNAGAAGNILRMGKMAAMADSYLQKEALARINDFVRINAFAQKDKSDESGRSGGCGESAAEGYFIPQELFEKEAPIIRLYVFMELMRRISGSAKDLGLVHAQQLDGLFARQVGKRVNLPYGMLAVRQYDGLWLGKAEAYREPSAGTAFTVETRQFPRKKGAQFPKNMYTKWFDCDKIKGTPVVRTRQPGDYITLADGSRKALRRYMIDEKIPGLMRDKVPLLADGSHVMWVIGYRISEYYKVEPETKRIFQADAKESDRIKGETEDKSDGR